MSQSERAKVLVVEDEPQLRQLVAELCQTIGLDTSTAEDGLDALDKLGANPVDVVLLDLNMPRMGGLELLGRLREAAEPLPAVIVLTALTDPKSRTEAVKLGAIDYVEKPVRMADLKRRVQRALTITALERRLEQAGERLREIRTTDRVTGVGATSQLFSVLEAEFHAASVGERPLSCVVVSDESYARTLDEAGREAGEKRLRALVDHIESRLHGADRVFRVDAAEFVILLPGRARDGAAEVVTMIARATADEGSWQGGALAIAAATYPHPELAQASLLYRAVNLTLAQARSMERVCYFEGF